MVVSSEPAAKRKRIEGPTPEAIAQSNAHLQSRGARRKSWMVGGLETSAPRAHAAVVPQDCPMPDHDHATPPLMVSRIDDTGRRGEQRAPAPPAEHRPPAGIPSADAQPGQQAPPQPPRHVSPALVRYEQPFTVSDASPASAHLATPSWKSMERAPPLPSPAPSEENTNSPTGAEHAFAPKRAHPHRSQHANQVSIPNSRPHGADSPLAMQWSGPPPPGSIQASMLGNPPPQPRVSTSPLSHTQYAPRTQRFVSSPQFQGKQPAIHHRQSMHRSATMLPPAAAILPSNAPPLHTSPLHSAQHDLPQQMRPLPRGPAASRIPKAELLARLGRLGAQSGVTLSSVESGRLSLLRDAVEKDDWFYQVLSQIFCLRTVMPSLLPKCLRDLPDASWESVSALLCPNEEVAPKVLAFFADFPEPIMEVYSDAVEVRNLYEHRALTVKEFLIALPRAWEPLLQTCTENCAPPLVEELVNDLRLHSAVLRTTCFRAIARRFWGLDETPGMQALFRLHELDQRTYQYILQGWRRTAQEKTQAVEALRRLYVEWVRYEQNAARGSADPPLPFTVAPNIDAVFSTLPVSLNSRFTLQQPQVLVQQPSMLVQQTPQQRWLAHQVPGHPQRHRTAQAQPAPAMPKPYANHGQWAPLPASSQTLYHDRAGQGQCPPGISRVFPTLSEVPRAQPTHPDPNRSALHQAYLRSPILLPAHPGVDISKFYRYVMGYALAPATISKRSPVQSVRFDISDDMFEKIPQSTSSTVPGAAEGRLINEESLMFRVRCCAVPAEGFATESSWVVAESTWPEEMTLSLNGTQLDTRRKLHHGRYLPAEVTSHVVKGENTLKILINRHPNDKRKFDFAIGVETIGIMSYEDIKDKAAHIDEHESLAAIKTALSGTNDSSDDEITITSSNMTIAIVEPLSRARLVNIPARGANCLHKDVFDLDVFLSCCKRDRRNGTTVVDCWRCPLCRGDVRPHTLVIDDFLVKVREELQKRDLLDVKAIVVEPDGSWTPKAVERTSVRSDSLAREEGGEGSSAAPQKVVEVIELD